MDPRRHLHGGQSFRVSGRSGNVGDLSGLTGERSETLAENLSDFVLAMRQMPLAVEQSHQNIAQTGKSHVVGRLAASGSSANTLLTTSQIQQMKAGSSSGYSGTAVATAATCPIRRPIDAVLVDVQRVE